MDLRQFFGEWKPGQFVHAAQETKAGSQSHILEVVAFEPARVALHAVEGSGPLNIEIEDTPQGNVAAYSFEIITGSKLVPSDLEGRNLQGVTLLSPPSPSSLTIHGEMTLSSSTLYTNVNGRMELERSATNGAASTLKLNSKQGQIDAEFAFIGLLKK